MALGKQILEAVLQGVSPARNWRYIILTFIIAGSFYPRYLFYFLCKNFQRFMFLLFWILFVVMIYNRIWKGLSNEYFGTFG